MAYLKLISVILLWGGVYHVAKFLVSDTDIWTVAFLRFSSAGVVLLIMYRSRHRRIIVHRPTRHWRMLFLIGLIGIFGYTTLFFAAESLIPANNVAILYAFTPCITAILSKFFLKQQIPKFAYVGIIVALLGTIVVISLSEISCNGELICTGLVQHLSLGQILAILASICMCIYNILNKKAAMMNLDPMTITTFSAVFGAILLFFAFWAFGAPAHNLLHKSFTFWLAMFYTSIFATVISYKWYSEAIKYIGIGQTAVFLNGVPLSTVLIGVILLGQSINPKIAIAGLVIILGVLITNYAVNKQKNHTK